jgi:hypothetical protein
MAEFVDTTALELPEWQSVRAKIKEGIELCAPDASVYPYWELEFDPETLLRKVTPLLTGKNNDSDIFHAWMCGITAAPLKKGSDGGREFVGGFAFTWILRLELEGFFDPNGNDPCNDPWRIAENEMQKITVLFFRNSDMAIEWAKFGEIEWSSLDSEAFADGNNLIVAQGGCDVEVQISIEV